MNDEMKKTCLLLLLLVGIIYINEGYKIISEDMPVKSTTEGSLSDVADEVIAIPLETTSDCRLKHATQRISGSFHLPQGDWQPLPV